MMGKREYWLWYSVSDFNSHIPCFRPSGADLSQVVRLEMSCYRAFKPCTDVITLHRKEVLYPL